MLSTNKYSALAIVGGCLLAAMIHINSQLASNTSSINASWFAHGIGAIAAWCLIMVVSPRYTPSETNKKAPKLFYLGGIPGAFTVILASMTVNSSIGLSGTLALGLVGQLLCSMLSEHLGLFRLDKKTFSTLDFVPILFVIVGSMLLIYARY